MGEKSVPLTIPPWGSSLKNLQEYLQPPKQLETAWVEDLERLCRSISNMLACLAPGCVVIRSHYTERYSETHGVYEACWMKVTFNKGFAPWELQVVDETLGKVSFGPRMMFVRVDRTWKCRVGLELVELTNEMFEEQVLTSLKQLQEETDRMNALLAQLYDAGDPLIKPCNN